MDRVDHTELRSTCGLSFPDFVRSRGRFYSDARSWIDAMRWLNLVIGMRIHGAIAAIQGHSLGVCVPHDGRTYELVRTMAYPFIMGHDLYPEMTLSELAERIDFDPVLFDRTRAVLAERLRSVLTESGLEIADLAPETWTGSGRQFLHVGR